VIHAIYNRDTISVNIFMRIDWVVNYHYDNKSTVSRLRGGPRSGDVPSLALGLFVCNQAIFLISNHVSVTQRISGRESEIHHLF